MLTFLCFSPPFHVFPCRLTYLPTGFQVAEEVLALVKQAAGGGGAGGEAEPEPEPAELIRVPLLG